MSDDLSTTLSNILSNPQSMQQLQNVAASLGLTNGGNEQSSNTGQNNNQGFDLSALLSSLGSGTNQQNQSNQSNQNNQNGGGLDLSSLLAGLSGNANQSVSSDSNTNTNNQNGGSMPDLSGLIAMLGGGNANNNTGSSSGGMPNIDMNTIAKIGQAMATMNASNKNVDLLHALKPHFSDKRSKKVDDAIKIMQLIKMLPLLKDSGLFGG